MFEKNLKDFIKGLRSNKRNEYKYLEKNLMLIQKEINSTDPEVKSTALSKLIYLQMLGYDIKWASFNVVEVMALASYEEKRIGYLAAIQSFHEETEVLMLTTNLFRKDLMSRDVMEVSLALEGLNELMTRDLGLDLIEDILRVSKHEFGFIRKKAIFVLYKLLKKSNEVASRVIPILKERLGDDDNEVVSATATVICELAKEDPRSYLPLAPKLYRLLNESDSNWMVIKIVKLFAMLAPQEPRLAKKLYEPLLKLINNTNASSLLYEGINTAVVGNVIDYSIKGSGEQQDGSTMAEICAEKLSQFIYSKDQNLQYLGFETLAVLQRKCPELGIAYIDTVIKGLDDVDIGIRMKALNVVEFMANKSNIEEIVEKLVKQLELSATNILAEEDENELEKKLFLINDSEENFDVEDTELLNDKSVEIGVCDESIYREKIITTVLAMLSHNNYSLVKRFDWCLAILMSLVENGRVASTYGKIAGQIIDVTARVKTLRKYSVHTLIGYVMNNTDRRHRAGGAGFIAEVFNASIYLIGEYCQLLTHSTQIEQLIKDILNARFLANHKEAGIDYVVTFKALVKLYVELFCRFESIVEDGGYDEELIETRREQLGEIVTFGIASVEKVKTYRDSSKYSDFGLLQWVLVSIRKSISTNPGSVDSVWNGLVKKSSQLSTPMPKIDSPTSLPDGELCLSASLLKSFINSYELNPIAPTAQSRVEIPEGLRPILDTALVDSELLSIPDTKHALINAFEIFENSNVGEIPSSNLGPGNTDDNSNKRHQRSIKPAKGVDTRFYIKRSDANKHKSDTLSNGQNSEEIPIMPLELNKESSTTNSLNQPHLDKGLTFEKNEHVEIIHDENLLDHTENDNASSNPTSLSKSTDSPATLLQPQKSHNTAISSSAPPLSQPKGYTQQVLLKQGGIRLKLLDQVVKDPQSRQPISTKKLHHPSPHLETVEVLSVLKFKLKPKLFSTFNRLTINCADDFILNNTNQFGIPILPLVINLDTFKASGQPVVDKSVIHISEDKCGFSVLFPILVHQSVFKVFSSPIPQTSPRGDNSVDASNSAAVPVVAVSIVIELSNEAANDDARFSSNKLVVYCSLPILT